MIRLLALLAIGCEGPTPAAGPQSRPVDGAGGPPTWHQDVAPIVVARCAGCHNDSGFTFALDDYAAAQAMAGAMAGAAADRRMPPWLAEDTDTCAPPLPWKHDRRLTDAEIATLQAWAAAGAPEGDAASAAPLDPVVPLALEGVSATVEPLAPFTTEGEADEFICFTLDPQLDADVWLTGVEVVPDNEAVVHHALVFTDPDGESLDVAGADGAYPCFGGPGIGNTGLVAAWAPGAPPMELPADAGMPITAGSRLVMQVHYHPSGAVAAPDRTALRLRYTTAAPAHEAGLALIGNAGSRAEGLLPGPNDRGRVEFRVPAGVADHTEEMEFRLPRAYPDLHIWTVGTHAHYLGTDLRFGVRAPDGAETCLVETPRWDFNWQGGYDYDGTFDELPVVKGGDTLTLHCAYDNTLDNPGVAAALADAGLDAPIDVYLGEETLDEMCIGVLGYLL